MCLESELTVSRSLPFVYIHNSLCLSFHVYVYICRPRPPLASMRTTILFFFFRVFLTLVIISSLVGDAGPKPSFFLIFHLISVSHFASWLAEKKKKKEWLVCLYTLLKERNRCVKRDVSRGSHFAIHAVTE